MESVSAYSMTLKQVVEALVFASPKPLTTKEILAALKSAGNPEKTDDASALEYAKTKEDELEAVLAEIAREMVDTGRSFQLMEQANGWSLVTDPKAVHWVRQLYPEAKPTRLSGPQLETLAIIAYRQPVTRADIEAVRGVAVDGPVQVLMERSLIKIAGRAELPGRPLLYSTTEYFLQHFGLKKVEELPNAQELRKIELPKAEVPAEPAPAEGEAAAGTEEKGKKGRKKKGAEGASAPAEPATTAAEAAAAPAEQTNPESAEGTAAPVEEPPTDADSVQADASAPDASTASEAPAAAPESEPEPAPEPQAEPEPVVEAEPISEPEPAPVDEPPLADDTQSSDEKIDQ